MVRRQNPVSLRHFGFLLLAFLALGSVSSAEWKEKVLYSFQGGTDGATPAGGVVFDKAGNLYGAASYGGLGGSGCPSGGCGTVWELSPPKQMGGAWTETTIYSFQGFNEGNDGFTPSGGLIIDRQGNLYGTTAYGGTGSCTLLGARYGCGTVYELSPPAQQGGAWTETILYSFQGGKDGYFAAGDLTFDNAGNLYGATIFGGGKGTSCNILYGGQCGTVFEVSPPKQKGGKWTEKVLHSFAGGTDGKTPNGGLTLDSKGAVYGTTPMGGNQLCNFGNGNIGCGTVFKLVPPTKIGGAWTEKILHRFVQSDGDGPNGGLIFDSKGSLYGTAGGGGAKQKGVVFRLEPEGGRWSESTLHTFGSGNAPCCPEAGLISDFAGGMYGVTLAGTHFRGTVFRLMPSSTGRGWSFSALYEFTGAPDGDHPVAALLLDKRGNLYSTTLWGGSGTGCGYGGCGTVFKVIR